MNEVIYYRQENAQLRLILGEKDHSAQQVINRLQNDIETLRIENERIRSRQ